MKFRRSGRPAKVKTARARASVAAIFMRAWVPAMAIVIVGMAALVYFQLLPMRAELERINLDLSALDSRRLSAQAALTQARSTEGQEATDEMIATALASDALLPGVSDNLAIWEMLDEARGDHPLGVVLTEEPTNQSTQADQSVKAQVWVISASGEWSDVLAFADALRDLDQLVTIDSIKFAPVTGDELRWSIATIRVSVWMYTGQTLEDMIAEAAAGPRTPGDEFEDPDAPADSTTTTSTVLTETTVTTEVPAVDESVPESVPADTPATTSTTTQP